MFPKGDEQDNWLWQSIGAPIRLSEPIVLVAFWQRILSDGIHDFNANISSNLNLGTQFYFSLDNIIWYKVSVNLSLNDTELADNMLRNAPGPRAT